MPKGELVQIDFRASRRPQTTAEPVRPTGPIRVPEHIIAENLSYARRMLATKQRSADKLAWLAVVCGYNKLLSSNGDRSQ